MHDEISSMARYVAPKGRAPIAGVVTDLARPVMAVPSTMAVGELEVVFRSPDVGCVAVHDDAGREQTGLITRAGLTSALTGRLGYGRAVLERRPVGTITDWTPLVVAPGTPVSEVATRAMSRTDDRRYDDVLVAVEGGWRSASTADVMRSLVAALAERSANDPHTRLPTRASTLYALARRSELVRGSGTRVVLALLDVRGMGEINARHGQEAGDVVLAELAARLLAALPRGCEAGRVDGDRFAVLATLPAVDDMQAALSSDAVLAHVLAHLAEPPAHLGAPLWPALHSAVVWSVAGGADPDAMLQEAERRLHLAAQGAALGAAS